MAMPCGGTLARVCKRFARRSLQMSEGYERGRLFNTVLLARIHADSAELEEACELGRRSVAMASGIRSARGRGYWRLNTEMRHRWLVAERDSAGSGWCMHDGDHATLHDARAYVGSQLT
jgi:hypothetical protein